MMDPFPGCDGTAEYVYRYDGRWAGRQEEITREGASIAIYPYDANGNRKGNATCQIPRGL